MIFNSMSHNSWYLIPCHIFHDICKKKELTLMLKNVVDILWISLERGTNLEREWPAMYGGWIEYAVL